MPDSSPRLLGLPVASPRGVLAAVLVLLAWHGVQATRDLYWLDSSELALAAITRGLPHPPGYPLHTGLGALLSTLLPFARHGAIVALSVVPTALAALPLTSLIEQLAAAPPPRWLAPVSATLALALQPIAWELATRVEVHALASALVLLYAALLVPALRQPRSRGQLVALGVAGGLVASTSPAIAVIGALATAPCLPALLRVQHRGGLVRACLGLLIGLVPFTYIPLAASFSSGFRWGAPVLGEPLLQYLSGADWEHNVGEIAFGANLLRWGLHLFRHGDLPLLVVGALAWLSVPLPRPARAFGPLTAALGFAASAWQAQFFVENPENAGHTLPGALLVEAALVAQLAQLRGRFARPATLGLLGCLAILWCSTAPTMSRRDRHGLHGPRLLAAFALDEMEPGGILLASSNSLVFPLAYLQEVERHRPDVVVFNVSLAGSPWYWEHLSRRHPTLRAAPRVPGPRATWLPAFLAANSGRPVRAESIVLLRPLGLPACPSGALYRADPICTDDDLDRARRARALLSSIADREAATGTLEGRALALVARTWATDDEQLGYLELALHALRAGMPGALRALVPPPEQLPVFDRASRRRPLPERRFLAEPRDLIWQAGLLLIRDNDPAGYRLLWHATRLGVPEMRDEDDFWRQDEE